MQTKRVVWVWVIYLAILVAPACGGRISQQPENAAVDVALESESLAVGETVLHITLKDASNEPINNATLNVKGDMSHAGMTPVLAEGISGGENGVYTTPFEWTMGGEWIVTVNVELSDGGTASKQFNLTVTGKMDMEGMENE